MLKAIKSSGVQNLCKRATIKRRSLIASCFCTGLAYRAYVVASTAGQGKHTYIFATAPQTPAVSSLSLPVHCCSHVCTALVSKGEWRAVDGDQGTGDKEAEARLRRLLDLRKWLENDLPETFSKGLFNSTDSNLFLPETVLEIERSCASPSLRLQ